MNNKAIFVWQGKVSREARLAEDPAFAAGEVCKAAISGDPAAQLSWGLMLLDGHGTPRDLGAAFKWIQLSARAGGRDAANMLGRCHELGWGTTVNLTSAARCYRAAAEMEHAWAQFNLACLILREDGVPGEPAEALGMLVRSGHAGNAKAMNMLGRCREEGWVGEPNLASARRWYLRAARGGCFRGAFHTARHLLAAGDIDRAVFWLRKSVSVAPADFCEELGAMFANHSDERLCAISALAFEQAPRAAKQAPSNSQVYATVDAAPRASQPRHRRRRGVLGAARRLAASAGIVRQ